MKATKKTLRFFSITQHVKEEAYLTKMHKEGWKFVRIRFPGIYTFEKCEPEDVTYQLDYNKDAIDEHSEYVQMFQDCGWEFIQMAFGYSYFRKASKDMDGRDEEIFNDDVSKTEMLNRVFLGRLVPLLVIFLAVVIPGMIRCYSHDKELFVLYVVLFFLYMTIFLSFALKYRKTAKYK